MKFSDWLAEKEREQFIEEATFGSGNMARVADLLASYLSKQLGISLYPYGGKNNYSETYTKSTGAKGIGYRFVSDTGKSIRIDFNETARGQLTGVTYWEKIFVSNPLYINVPSQLNSIEAVNLIVGSIISTGSDAQIQSLMSEGTINETIPNKPDISKLDPSLIGANGQLRRGAWELWRRFGVDLEGKTWEDLKKIAKEVNVQKGTVETTSRDKEIEQANVMLDNKKYADADTIFDDLVALTNMVIHANQPSLLVTGMAGVGKTFTVENVVKQSLGSEGKRWVSVKGKTTPMGLYMALFINRDKLIVFDDCDSVFGNVDSVNILKAALDSYDTRMVSWYTKSTQDVSQMNANELYLYYEDAMRAIKDGDPKVKLPNKFEFTGKIIFISNLNAARIDPAIKSRSFVIDVTLKREDLLKRIESILPSLDPGVDMKTKMEAFDALKEFSGKNHIITMRSVLRAIRLRQSGSPRWRELIKNYV